MDKIFFHKKEKFCPESGKISPPTRKLQRFVIKVGHREAIFLNKRELFYFMRINQNQFLVFL